MDVDRQLELLTAGAVDVISEAELRKKLERGAPLRVKLGIDPTASDIHLGFAVVLRRLRLFQDLGHTAVLIIGDFTAMVGDPSGKSATRPQPLEGRGRRARARATSSRRRASSTMSPERLEIVRNSEWLAPLDMEAVLRLTSQVTVAQMLERDDFAKRYADGVPISLMEFLYPLLQATDSVEVRADVELGGTDQLFNLIMGRAPAEAAPARSRRSCSPRRCSSGLDGEQKMSKSLGNYVGIAEPPAEQFGKIMSIPDALMPDVLPVRHRLAARADRRGARRSSRRATLHPNAAKRTRRPDGRRPVPRRRARARRPRPTSTACSRTTRRPRRCPSRPIDGAAPRKLSALAHDARPRGVEPRSRPRRSRPGAVKLDGVVAHRGSRVRRRPSWTGRAVQNGKRKWARLTSPGSPTRPGAQVLPSRWLFDITGVGFASLPPRPARRIRLLSEARNDGAG